MYRSIRDLQLTDLLVRFLPEYYQSIHNNEGQVLMPTQMCPCNKTDGIESTQTDTAIIFIMHGVSTSDRLYSAAIGLYPYNPVVETALRR